MRLPSHAGHAAPPVVFQAVPEDGDGVEDFVAALEEPRLVELGVEEDVFELFHRVAGVLGLDAVVPGEEGDLEAGQPGCLDVEQAVFQLLPEAGGGPVLDGEARPLGDLVVLAAVEALKLVAEVQGVRRARAGACPGRRSPGRAPRRRPAATRSGRRGTGRAAVDRPLGADQVGVALAVLGLVVDRPRGRRASPSVRR